jgi:hypothetical protein
MAQFPFPSLIFKGHSIVTGSERNKGRMAAERNSFLQSFGQ